MELWSLPHSAIRNTSQMTRRFQIKHQFRIVIDPVPTPDIAWDNEIQFLSPVHRGYVVLTGSPIMAGPRDENLKDVLM